MTVVGNGTVTRVVPSMMAVRTLVSEIVVVTISSLPIMVIRGMRVVFREDIYKQRLIFRIVVLKLVMLARREMCLLFRVPMLIIGSGVAEFWVVRVTMPVSIVVLCIEIVRLEEALDKWYSIEILLSKGNSG